MNSKNEIWKDIQGFDGKYQISNFGRVRSFSKWKNGGFLKPGKCGNPGPYLYVNLVGLQKSISKCYYVHKLVAISFLPEIPGKNEINHKDGNTLNNAVSNLEWCTHGENMKHAATSGILSKAHDFEKGSKHPKSKAVLQFDLSGNLVKEWESVNQIMRETGIPANYIFKCCNPKKYPSAKTAVGYIWRYKNGEANNQEAGS